jgi:hypothetical protein
MNPLEKRFAFDELHHQGKPAVRFLKAIDSGNAGMIECGESAGFALQARHGLAVMCQGRRQQLQSNVAPQLRVTRTVHFAHAAGAKRRDNFIDSKTDPRTKCHKACPNHTLQI